MPTFAFSVALVPLLLAVVGVSSAAPPHFKFKSIVTFGDSYTDTENVGDGGVAWPNYVAGYANVTLFPFAKAGAVCSNYLTPRPAPSLMESQVPSFVEQLGNGTISVNQSETLYTLWIGTNDVGSKTLLSGGTAPGVSIVEVTECAVNWVKTLYDLGARNFLFQGMIPLELAPMYTRDAYYSRFWVLPRNATAWNLSIGGFAKAGNALARLMLSDLSGELRGARIGFFNSHALFTDMYTNPSSYLNGTAEVNVKEVIAECVYQEGGTADTAACQTVPAGPARDSYLWWDELHPSEQANRVVAREVVAAVRGSQRWTTWFS